jgi:hypothetical protein
MLLLAFLLWGWGPAVVDIPSVPGFSVVVGISCWLPSVFIIHTVYVFAVVGVLLLLTFLRKKAKKPWSVFYSIFCHFFLFALLLFLFACFISFSFLFRF